MSAHNSIHVCAPQAAGSSGIIPGHEWSGPGANPAIPATRHIQVRIPLPFGGKRILVDEGLASLISAVVCGLPQHARTDFSCQGDPGQKKVSAYLLIASPHEKWTRLFAERLAGAAGQFAPYPIRIVSRGHWPEYVCQARRGSRIFIERDSIGGTLWREQFPWDSNYRDVAHRVNIRWRPEDFWRVRQTFRSLLSPQNLHHLHYDPTGSESGQPT